MLIFDLHSCHYDTLEQCISASGKIVTGSLTGRSGRIRIIGAGYWWASLFAKQHYYFIVWEGGQRTWIEHDITTEQWQAIFKESYLVTIPNHILKH